MHAAKSCMQISAKDIAETVTFQRLCIDKLQYLTFVLVPFASREPRKRQWRLKDNILPICRRYGLLPDIQHHRLQDEALLYLVAARNAYCRCVAGEEQSWPQPARSASG